MPVKLRLQRHGRKRRPFYHIVAADSRAKRDGRFIEKIGWFDPNHNPAIIDIDREKALEWLGNGAQPTDTVKQLLSATGILYKKHLLRGVKKGALTIEQANIKFQEWIEAKAAQKDLKVTMHEWRTKQVVAAPVVEETPVVVEAPAEEEAPAVEETTTEEVAAETTTEVTEETAE